MSFHGYDSWKSTDYAADDGPDYREPCPVCSGDADADPCSEECDEIMKSVRRDRVIKGNYEAAKRVLHLAKLYAVEGGPRDPRIGPCVAQIRMYRDYVALLRRAS